MGAPAEVRELATDLQFPEGPVVMPDGSVLVVEIRRGTLTRVTDGKVDVVAELGGGPNGAAIGPDGACYVANNGGFLWSDLEGMLIPFDLKTMSNQPADFSGGWIDRVDLSSGQHQVLYKECDGFEFRGPNDLVFDTDGGFYFTDFGKSRAHDTDRGGLYYGRADGSSVVQVARGLLGPNGCGLSLGGHRVYVAESYTGRLLAWDVTGPGKVASPMATVVEATKGHFDSMAVEAGGNVIVAAIGEGLCVVDPNGGHDYVALPDRFTTNVCFGGDDLKTAYVTLSGTGRLVALDWPRAGLKLAF